MALLTFLSDDRGGTVICMFTSTGEVAGFQKYIIMYIYLLSTIFTTNLTSAYFGLDNLECLFFLYDWPPT
jgi:hypothetical protein